MEMMTSLTPERPLRRMLDGVEQQVVVCGHTHVQFDRELDGVRVVNAGSVGMPYQGRRGAYWLRLGPGVDFRRSEYDDERAAREILASGYWAAENLANEIILSPPDPHQAEAYFEQLAGERGER
jgi:diadenosine tetraphosphatase ApaH/serine/threonine PP2A family protein phosphatase